MVTFKYFTHRLAVVSCPLVPSYTLNSRRVEHHSHGGPNRLGWKVCAELCAHHTIGAMCAAHLAPDNTVLGACLDGLGLVDVRNALTQVELSRLLIFYTLNLHQRGVAILRSESPLEAEAHSSCIQSHGLRRGRAHNHGQHASHHNTEQGRATAAYLAGSALWRAHSVQLER
jgi:hypothetical protein